MHTNAASSGNVRDVHMHDLPKLVYCHHPVRTCTYHRQPLFATFIPSTLMPDANCFSLKIKPVLPQAPCQHNFCLGCFKKWVAQGKKTCPTCRSGFPAKFAANPRINTALTTAIRMAKAGNARPSSAKNFERIQDKDRPDEAYTTERYTLLYARQHACICWCALQVSTKHATVPEPTPASCVMTVVAQSMHRATSPCCTQRRTVVSIVRSLPARDWVHLQGGAGRQGQCIQWPDHGQCPW